MTINESESMGMFLYAIKSPVTKDRYLSRLGNFFAFLELTGSIENQVKTLESQIFRTTTYNFTDNLNNLFNDVVKVSCVAKLDFAIVLPCPSDKLYDKLIDFENFKNYIPMQLESVRILEKNDHEILTEEKIVSHTILKTSFSQKSLHKLSKQKIETTLLSGPAQNTKFIITLSDDVDNTKVSIAVDLKLSLKYKIFTSLIKKEYKRMFTTILYKINTEIMDGLVD